MKGTLYLFPVLLSEESGLCVPATNLEAADCAECFITENARSARRALRSMGWQGDFNSRIWFDLNEHTREEELSGMLQPCREGKHSLLLSEAGCPTVADPGSRLVLLAHSENIPVKVLIGPSSVLLALMASGLQGQRFTFHGYLPKEKDPRSRLIRQMNMDAQKGSTQIFIETPYRNNRLLEELIRDLSLDTLLCVASELTSPSENILTLPVREWKKRKYDYNNRPAVFLIGSH
ncbi:MAG: SAM-dependent methyltransferase [Bacteroidia bacterium]|nr:SAM-dependent methyltransferase [Bacteroidia bacterium]